MHFHAYIPCILYILILIVIGAFLCLSLSLLLSASCSMAPKRKSTQSWNPLCSGASSSSDPSPSHVWFHDEKGKLDFLENFSRRGIHSEHQVILSDFFDTELPTVINSRGWESLCGVRSLVHPCSFNSSTPTCMDLIIQYLSLLLALEVCALWFHRILYPRCSTSWG